MTLASCDQPEVHSVSLRRAHHGMVAAIAPAAMNGARGIDSRRARAPHTQPHAAPPAQAINTPQTPLVPKAASSTSISLASPIPNPSGRLSDKPITGIPVARPVRQASSPSAPCDAMRTRTTATSPEYVMEFGILLQRRSVMQATKQTAIAMPLSTGGLGHRQPCYAPLVELRRVQRHNSIDGALSR